MSLGMTPPPQSLGEGLQVTNFDQCLHTVMVIGKCTDVFRGIFWFGCGVQGRGLYGRIFPWRNISWGKRNSMKRAQDFLALLLKKKQNNENINMKKFFQLKVRRSIKTENEQRLLCIWRVLRIL